MRDWLNKKLEQTPYWRNHIWFSNETHIYLNGAVKSPNNAFCGEAKINLKKPPQSSQGHCLCGLQCKVRSAGTLLVQENWLHHYHQQ